MMINIRGYLTSKLNGKEPLTKSETIKLFIELFTQIENLELKIKEMELNKVEEKWD